MWVDSSRAPLPPGPVMTPWRMIQLMYDPFTLLDECSSQFGDTYSLKDMLGLHVVTSSPEAARAVFSADPDLFVPMGVEIARPILGEHSVIMQSGARHRAQRKLMMPPFYGARMRTYGEIMRETALRYIASWRPGGTVNLTETMQNISLEVIIRAIFGVAEVDRVEQFRSGIRRVVEGFSPLVAFLPFTRVKFWGMSPWDHYEQAYAELTRLLFDEMDRRQGTPPGEDILSLLLGMRYDDGSAPSREEIRDQLITLLFAGHETTATSLAWALDQIGRDAAVRSRLLDEIAALGGSPSPEAIGQLPWLEAVCQETLRFFPVVPVVPRHVREDFDMAGTLVPKDTSIAVAIWSIHRRPELYPEPERWRPERFLERSYAPHEFLPFGGGHRRCLGAAFAFYEMKQVLAAIVSQQPLEPITPHPPRNVRQNVTMGPKTPIRMRVPDGN